jgi:monooxygenase
MSKQPLDVLIIGAGISGIGAACHLTRECPDKRYAILERRQEIGGTWSLFNYPGIRSDSDMYSFGFSFRPWTEPRVLADGPSIRQYVNDTAQEYDVLKHIRFGRKVTRASWSSEESLWTVETTDEGSGKTETWRARFMIGCTGYYNYDQGYRPEFPGEKDFQGQIVHPQFWPKDLDYKGKRVVIIGSGATAITLVPSMAPDAEHVTMLQRSPTYILSLPSIDKVAAKLQKWLPSKLAYKINRTRNILLARGLYEFARRRPDAMKRFLLGRVKKQIGTQSDMRHFTPSYNPWDERLCVVPSGDLFKAIRAGKASVETDHIDCFTQDGIRLKSGQELKADIIVTATGLQVQMLGGTEMVVDGEAIRPREHMIYKGVLMQDVPNAAMIVGYTNISWTLKVDIACEYICRLLKHMDAKGYRMAVPRDEAGCMDEQNTILGALSSGYVMRASDTLPRQGTQSPWQVSQNYLRDVPELRYGKIEDGVLRFDEVAESDIRNAA